MFELELRRSVMRIRRAGMAMVTAVGGGGLGLSWSPAARGQGKLEYKFPEGKKLTYKTTTKTHQVLTLMGMEIPSDVEGAVVSSRTIGKRRGDSTLPVEEKVESSRTEMTLPGGINVTYDSNNPDAKIDN